MKKSISILLATSLLFIGGTTTYATEENKYLKYYDDREIQYVTADTGLNVRRQPNVDSQIIDTLVYGSEVEVLCDTEEDEEWTAIYYDQCVYYVCNQFISKEKPEEIISIVEDNNTSTSGEYLGTLRLTAYEHDGSLCANGNYPTEYWTCASNELPFGTIVEINGLGQWIVEDTGGFGYGALDLFLGDPYVCEQFGVQYADVWVIRYGY